MKSIKLRIIGGGVLVAIGILWILQGAGVAKGSVMTGDPTWIWVGVAFVVAGGSIMASARRKPGGD